MVAEISLEMPHLGRDLLRVSKWLGRVPGVRGTLTHLAEKNIVMLW